MQVSAMLGQFVVVMFALPASLLRIESEDSLGVMEKFLQVNSVVHSRIYVLFLKSESESGLLIEQLLNSACRNLK